MKQTEINLNALKYVNVFYYSRLSLFLCRKYKKRLSESKYRFITYTFITIFTTYFAYLIYMHFSNIEAGPYGTISTLLEWLIVFLLLQFLLSLFRGSFNYTLMPNFFRDNPGLRKVNKNTANRNQLPYSVQKNEYIELLHDYSFEIHDGKKQTQLLQARINADNEGTKGVINILLPKLHYVIMRVELAPKVNFPHFYLDNTLNGKSLLRSLKRQTLQLESTFPHNYILHHEKGHEGAVRYVLPPDNMMALLNFKYPYDLEFYKNNVWIIAKGYCMSERDIKAQLQFAETIYSIY